MVNISIDRKVGDVVSYLHCGIFLYFWQTSANSLYSFSVDHSLAWSTVGRAWSYDRMLVHTSNRPSTSVTHTISSVLSPNFIDTCPVSSLPLPSHISSTQFYQQWSPEPSPLMYPPCLPSSTLSESSAHWRWQVTQKKICSSAPHLPRWLSFSSLISMNQHQLN